MNLNKRELRICFIGGIDSDSKCGVKDYTIKLITALREKGTHIISADYGMDSKFTIHIGGWKKLSDFLAIIKKLKARGIKLIHIEYPSKAYGKSIAVNFAVLCYRLAGFYIVFTTHEYSNRSWLGRIRQWPSFISANEIIVVEPQFKIDIEKLLFCKNKVHYINIGSNLPKSDSSDIEIAFNRDTILSQKTNTDTSFLNKNKIAIYFGFVNEFKCFLEILNAIVILKKKCSWNSIFVVIGELSREDDYQNKVLQFIEDKKLQFDVMITGYLESDKAADYLRAADYAILPFYYGVSVRNGSFLSAYQEGLDIITSKPIGEFPYNDVIFINQNTSEAIAEAIMQVQDSAKKNDKRVIDYSWDKIADRHLEIYRSYLQ